MKKIKLAKNKYALVDNTDYEILKLHRWRLNTGTNTYYAMRGNKPVIMLHNQIMNPPKGMEVDHINRNGLDNRRKNLRICTHAQNIHRKSMQKNNTSGYRGVCWNKRDKKWQANIAFNGKQKHLGSFSSAIEAYEKYREACIKYHGEYANP